MNHKILTTAIFAALAVVAGKMIPVYRHTTIDHNGIAKMLEYPYHFRRMK